MAKQLAHEIRGIHISLEPIDDELANGWFTVTPTGVLIRARIVDSAAKIHLLAQAAERLHSEWTRRNPFYNMPLSMMMFTLCSQKDEWDLITVQNILTTWLQYQQGLSDRCGMMSIPTEHFYVPKIKPSESEFFLKAVAKLPALLNGGAWETYCRFLNKEIEAILQNLPLESMDSYTLEAHFKNFNHEIGSELLRNLEKDIQNILLRMGGIQGLIEFPSQVAVTLIELEKRLIKARTEVRRLLQYQYDTLCHIERIIPIIEEAHPSFTAFKYRAALLRSLMENQLEIPNAKSQSWAQVLMLLQLLQEEFGMITVINCDTGWDRTNMAFAVMLTISLLKQWIPKYQLIDAVLHWREGEADIKGRDFVILFQETFFDVLENLCIPLTRSAGKTKDMQWSDSQIVSNPEFLDLLPIDWEMRNEEGEKIRTKIIQTSHTGAPTGLTKAGHFFMTQLFPDRL